MYLLCKYNKSTYLVCLVKISNDRARAQRLTVEVRDGKRRRDIRMQSLIAPELTPTHARSAALVARLFVFYLGRAYPKYFRPTNRKYYKMLKVLPVSNKKKHESLKISNTNINKFQKIKM